MKLNNIAHYRQDNM